MVGKFKIIFLEEKYHVGEVEVGEMWFADFGGAMNLKDFFIRAVEGSSRVRPENYNDLKKHFQHKFFRVLGEYVKSVEDVTNATSHKFPLTYLLMHRVRGRVWCQTIRLGCDMKYPLKGKIFALPKNDLLFDPSYEFLHFLQGQVDKLIARNNMTNISQFSIINRGRSKERITFKR